jgi:PAS domain S-box-containing protein
VESSYGKVVMPKENLMDSSSGEIQSIIAQIRNFSPEKPIRNAVIYFWESHTDKNNDPRKIYATIDLIYREFDLSACEKYEVRTGYLSRYNFLSKPIDESSQKEKEEAIIKGKQQQNEWIDRCKPELPGFKIKDWRECIFKDENPFLEGCVELVREKIKDNGEFENAVASSVNDFAQKYGTNVSNGQRYIIEEVSWMLTLPLLHSDRPIYLVHVDAANEAVDAMFHHFPNLKKAVRWLSPRFNTVVFKNVYDFLLDYRNGKHTGYSYAIENSAATKDLKREAVQEETKTSRNPLLSVFEYTNAERNLLRSIIGKLPGHVYWTNEENVYLGCNDGQAQLLKLKSREEIIGKTNYDFHSKEEAEKINQINKEVMKSGISYEGDESSSTESGGCRSYVSNKRPLYDPFGKIIGLLGVSIDITDRKRAEELETQNKVQRKINRLAEQVFHDIQTPLQTLSMILEVNKNLPEKAQAAFQDSVNNIKKILQVFLEYSTGKDVSVDFRPILVSKILADILDQKEIQYKDRRVKFQYLFDPSARFSFIYGRDVNFERMISNIINNSVEACETKDGIIKLVLSADDDSVKITIQDNGKGMPSEIVEKLMKNESVSSTKECGYGIGMPQIQDTLQELNGTQVIESTQNVGTKIMLTIPRYEKLWWETEKIDIRRGQIVVIVDDDVGIHGKWKERLGKYTPGISLKFFREGQAAVDFINTCGRREDVFLLSDYELRNQPLNGLDVIQKSGIGRHQSILVSEHYGSKGIEKKSRGVWAAGGVLPKEFINDVRIVFEGMKVGNLSFEKVDVIMLDDEKFFVNLLSDVLRSSGLVVDIYYDPRTLKENLSKYSCETRIIIDNWFDGKEDGDVLANLLSEKGFKNLCVLTGLVLDSMCLKYPDGTKFISKGSDNCEAQILDWCKRRCRVIS